MHRFLPIAALVCLTLAVAIAWRGRGVVRGTSLRPAFGCLIAMLGTAIAALLVDVLAGFPGGWSDQVWQAIAVLMLTPLMSVLGARRPGSVAWGWFVVLPMVVVLEWPALTSWSADGPPEHLALEGAQVAGIGIALVMGAGNYFGTRFMVPAALYATSVVFMALPQTEWAMIPGEMSRFLASAALLLAALLTSSRLRRLPHRGQHATEADFAGWSRAWVDFRDFYGIVWGKRVMDRINEAARQERWPVRLDLEGFIPCDAADGITREAAIGRIDFWMRTLLRRFVEPAWIDERMK